MLITNISTSDLENEYAKAEADLAEMEQLIRNGKPADIPHGKLRSEFRRLFSEEQYCAMVEKAKHYIYEGDIFQVVLSNRRGLRWKPAGRVPRSEGYQPLPLHVLLLQR